MLWGGDGVLGAVWEWGAGAGTPLGLCAPTAGLAAPPRCPLADGSDAASIFLIPKKNPYS